MDLQDSKIEAGRDYESGMLQLLGRQDDIRAADPSLVQKLEEMQKAFHATTEENRKSLERMQKGMDRLHNRIMQVARKAAEDQAQFVYGASGQMQTRRKTSIGVSESA